MPESQNASVFRRLSRKDVLNLAKADQHLYRQQLASSQIVDLGGSLGINAVPFASGNALHRALRSETKDE